MLSFHSTLKHIWPYLHEKKQHTLLSIEAKEQKAKGITDVV